MNNPIDDIYKDHLKDRSFEFQEGDWLSAKRMLELQERKYKIPFWFWMGVGMISLAGMAHMYIGPIKKPEDTHITANVIDRAPELTDTRSIDDVPSSTGDRSEELAQLESTTSTINEQRQLINSPGTTSDGSDTSINEESKLRASQGHAATYPNTPVPVGQVFSNFRNTLNHTTPRPNADPLENKNQTPGHNSQSGSNVGKNKNTPISSAESTAEIGSSLIIPLAPIPYPIIEKLKYPIDFPTINTVRIPTDIDHDKVKKVLSLGAYAAFSMPSPNWSAGLLADYPLTNKWYTAVGIGANWNSSFSIITEETDAQVDDRSTVFAPATLNEKIEIRRLSLEIPISIGYQFSRHQFYVGALFQKSLWAERRNQASLMSLQESIEPSSPDLDLTNTAGQNQTPIILAQESRSTQDANLLKWNTYLTAGYGYDITQHLGVRIEGNYRISKDLLITSAVADNVFALGIPEWSTRLSIVWRF